MAKYKMWVRVPAGQGSKLTRPVQKTVEANSGVEAGAMLRGQFGTSNVVGAAGAKVMPGYKPRSRVSTPSRSTYTPRTQTSFSRKYRYSNYNKPYSRSSSRRRQGQGDLLGDLIILIVKGIWFMLKIFNLITHELMFVIFGRGKVHYWAIHNKHTLAFSASSINLMMLFLLFKILYLYLVV